MFEFSIYQESTELSFQSIIKLPNFLMCVADEITVDSIYLELAMA